LANGILFKQIVHFVRILVANSVLFASILRTHAEISTAHCDSAM